LVSFAVAVLVVVAPACGDKGSSSSTPAPGSGATTTSSSTTTSTSTTTTTIRRTAALREAVSLRVGESVSLPSEGLTLTFTDVVSDSRCPPRVECISGGEASISVAVSKNGASPTTLTIRVSGSARSGKYTIEVVSLSYGRPATASVRVT